MTVREYLEDILVKYGMFVQQAKKILDISIPKINEISDDYKIQWDEYYDVYNDEMYDFLFSIIKEEALKWIDEHIPEVWYRDNFIN